MMTRVRRCAACHTAPATWAWQPWGPDEDIRQAFVRPGYHYRGFPVVPVCDDCKTIILSGDATTFRYRGGIYMIKKKEISESPL